jgi:hypothetical protein
MKLPKKKLEEIEYYEVETSIVTHGPTGKPKKYDKVVLHFGEYEKETKLFGLFTIWTTTIPDRTEEFTFAMGRALEDAEEGIYSFSHSEPFKQLYSQLDAYFEFEAMDVYEELNRHEIEFITS